MKETINVTDYAGLITGMLPKGLLLNTNGDKFNSMVIGWGHLGTLWSRPTFHVYVRQGRYTKSQLDKTQEFTISVPLKGISRDVFRICGTMSGREIDKADIFTLEEPRTNHTPGVREYPLTIECKVLFSQELPLEKIPEDICKAMYPQDVDGTYCMANRDAHTMYVGEIVDAYMIKEEQEN